MTQTIYFISGFALAGLVVAAAGMGTELTVPVSPATSPAASRFQPLPAMARPPVIQAQGQEAERAAKSINQGRLSKQQLRQTLLNHPNAHIRERAQEAAKVSATPSYKASSVNSVTLTPQTAYSSLPNAWLQFFGANLINEPSGVTTYALSANFKATPFGGTVAVALASVDIVIPNTGWYLIDFYGYGKPKTTLRISANRLASHIRPPRGRRVDDREELSVESEHDASSYLKVSMI